MAGQFGGEEKYPYLIDFRNELTKYNQTKGKDRKKFIRDDENKIELPSKLFKIDKINKEPTGDF